MELETEILEIIRNQSLIRQQLLNLQNEANRLQTQMADAGGQLKAYLKIYHQQNGVSFDEAINADQELMNKVAMAQEDGKRIASGTQPQNGLAMSNDSALQQAPPTQTTTQPAVAPTMPSPSKGPSLRRVQGNRPVSTKPDDAVTPVRTIEPVKVVVDDDPPMPSDKDDE